MVGEDLRHAYSCASGGGSSKFFLKFADLFRSTNLIFRTLRKHYEDPILSKIVCSAGKVEKKQAESGVFGHFLKKY